MDKRTSGIWAHFTIVDYKNCIAKCDLCLKKYSFKSTLTNLKKHLFGCHGIKLSSGKVSINVSMKIV